MNYTQNFFVFLGALTLLTACSTGQKKLTPREAFMAHWKEAGSDVKVMQVQPTQGGMYRGDGIVDGRPQEEFYNPSTGEFTTNAPVNGYVAGSEEKKVLYKDVMAALATDLIQSLPTGSRVAILKVPSDAGKESRLSADLENKLQMGLTNGGISVVDRAKMDEVMKEQQLQQSQSALFDPTTSARIGKLMGANTVITGSYHALLPRKVAVTVKIISAETSRVIAVKETEIPLDGAGADNRDEITEMVQGQ